MRIRIISLLLVVFLFVGFIPTPVRAEGIITRDLIIVSMGDSYSSGEGIDDFYDSNLPIEERVESQDWLAHRSQNAWGGQLTLDGVDGQMRDNRNTHWFFVATSGAKTKHLDHKFTKDYHKNINSGLIVSGNLALFGSERIDAQLDVIDKIHDNGKTVDYVTLTIGGNDADFAKIITSCVVGSTYLTMSRMYTKLWNVWDRFFEKGGIRDSIKASYQKINSKAPEAHIIVAGYPKLLDAKGFTISKEEADVVNRNVSMFNAEIEEIVKECQNEGMPISFVPVDGDFKGHEAFTEDPYLNGIYIGTKAQDINDTEFTSAYSMHPNLKGAEVYRSLVQDEIDRLEQEREPEQRTETAEYQQADNINYKPSDYANDLAARMLSDMFIEKSSLDGNSYVYDADNDGTMDWLFEFTAGDGRPMWMVAPVGGKSELLYLRDQSAAGGASLEMSSSGKIIAEKSYSSAGTGMSTYFPINGEEVAGHHYESVFNGEKYELEFEYRVNGSPATEDEYNKTVNDLGLSEIMFPHSIDSVKTIGYSIPGDSIPSIASELATFNFVTDSYTGDFNGDGYTDAIIIADLSDGKPKGTSISPIYAEADLDDTITWSGSGIIIASGPDGTADVTISSAEAVRQTSEYQSANRNEELVSDAFSGVIPANTNQSLGHVEATYYVPQINISSSKISAINSEIMEISKDDIDAVNGSNDYAEIMESHYEWAKNGNILSLLYVRTSVHDYVFHYVYNINIAERRLATQEEVLAECRYSEQGYRFEAKKAMGSAFWDFAGPNPDPFLDEMLQQTMSDENVSAAQPYMNSKGHLCIACLIKVPAGGGNLPKLIDLDFYSVSPFYAESITGSGTDYFAPQGIKYIANVSSSAYLRTTPESRDDNIIMEVPLGEIVNYVGYEENGFSRVNYRGTYGYVNNDYLSDNP